MQISMNLGLCIDFEFFFAEVIDMEGLFYGGVWDVCFRRDGLMKHL